MQVVSVVGSFLLDFIQLLPALHNALYFTDSVLDFKYLDSKADEVQGMLLTPAWMERRVSVLVLLIEQIFERMFCSKVLM